jgi:hypothetical protein
MSETPMGKVGRVLVRIRGAESPGEVELTVDGLPEIYLAYANDEVTVGSDVLVIGDRGARRVEVVPWQIAESE